MSDLPAKGTTGYRVSRVLAIAILALVLIPVGIGLAGERVLPLIAGWAVLMCAMDRLRGLLERPGSALGKVLVWLALNAAWFVVLVLVLGLLGVDNSILRAPGQAVLWVGVWLGVASVLEAMFFLLRRFMVWVSRMWGCGVSA